jgi:ATP-dependent 26S proteasome regulatory subunit
MTDKTKWAVIGNGYFACEKTEEALPPGQYIPAASDHRGVFLVKKDVNVDDLLVLPDSKSEYVVDEIRKFWRKKDIFSKHGFLWKRGVLLYGPPGSGKTSTLQQISSLVTDIGGISIYCNAPETTAEALRLIRRIEPARPIVLMMEDVDAIIGQHGEADLLALLDGELQIDNILNIATTNYPEKLDPRFVQRPSRFDDIVKIGMPSPEARDAYLKAKNPGLSDEERARWVSFTDGFSIAALKEVIVSVECLGRDLEETIKRINFMFARKPSSEDDSAGIGFLAN